MAATSDQRRLKLIRKSFIENVSIAGWKEAFDEQVGWIRRSYRAIIFVFSVCCIFLCVKTLRKWAFSRYNDDVTDFFDQASVAFSNVTVCTQVFLNRSFVRENLVIPEGFYEKYRLLSKDDRDQFFDQLIIYLSLLIKGNIFTALQLASFKSLIRANTALLGDYPEFLDKASYPCESILRKCSFGGQEFDCCRDAVRLLSSDDGICYLIPLNFDYDNAIATPRTYRQSIAGPNGGLTIEASVDTSLSPWAENVTSNGFSVFVSPIGVSVYQAPLIASHGTETFIRVVPTLYHSIVDCARPGELRMDNSDGSAQNFTYDPEGTSCNMQKAVQTARKFLNCVPMVYSIRPNSSLSCSPQLVNAVGAYAQSDVLEALRTMVSPDTGMTFDKIKKFHDTLEEAAQVITSINSRCPSHCEYWSYSSTSNFYELEREDESNVTMRSRIRVYYGELSFSRFEQVDEYAIYLAFCDLANIVALYWGMSIVSFFHVFYYVPRYLLLKWKVERKRKMSIGAIGD